MKPKMNVQTLRRHFPKFIYQKFEHNFNTGLLQIKFFYSIPPDHNFTHQLAVEFPSETKLPQPQLDNLIFHIGLSLVPSYWKTTCSPIIEIPSGYLTSDQIAFWHKLFIKGMGEYYFQNQIDFTSKNFIQIHTTGSQPTAFSDPKKATKPTDKHSALILVGGGKDSVVTLELLKNHFDVTPYVNNPRPVMKEVIKSAHTLAPIFSTSHLDPHLLSLNQQGYLNGHTPVTSFNSWLSVLVAVATGQNFIALSNERSSNEGNTTYLGQEINHQYDKTFEYETDFSHYLGQIPVPVSYFSFLRPLYELQITQLFSRYPQYFHVFTSCNRNFTIDPSSHPHGLWCCHCPKCLSTALMLACFIGKDQVSRIMGTYPPDLPENSSLMDQLLGHTPIKPFECVLTRTEAKAAYSAVTSGDALELNQLLSSWSPSPNLPPQFTSILKSSLI